MKFIVKFRNIAILALSLPLAVAPIACSGDDGGGGGGGTPGDDTPQLIAGSYTVFEADIVAGAAILTISSSSEDSGELTWSISSQIKEGADSDQLDLFSIANSGAITVAADKSLELATTYVLMVEVSDGEVSDSATVTVTTRTRGSTGLQFGLDSYEIENAATAEGTAILTFALTAADGAQLTYSITSQIKEGDTDRQLDLFSIDNDGALAVAAGKSLELATTYVLTVEVSDGDASDSATVNVATRIAGPQFSADSYTVGNSNIEAGAHILAFALTATGGAQLTYSITSQIKQGAADAQLDLFSIDNNGTITVAAGKRLESLTTYTLIVEVSDGTTSDSATVVVSTRAATTSVGGNEPDPDTSQLLGIGPFSLNRIHAERARLRNAADDGTATQTVTINWAPIRLRVTALTAAGLTTDGSITASWPALKGASSYIVRLFDASLDMAEEESVAHTDGAEISYTFTLSDNEVIYLSLVALNANDEESLPHVLGPIDPESYTVVSGTRTESEEQTLYSLQSPAIDDSDLSDANVLAQLATAVPPVTLTLVKEGLLDYHFLQIGSALTLSDDTQDTQYSNPLSLDYLAEANFYAATARHIVAIPTDSAASGDTAGAYSVAVAADDLLLGLKPGLDSADIIEVDVLRRTFTAATEAIADGATDPGAVIDDPSTGNVDESLAHVWLTLPTGDPPTGGATTNSGAARCSESLGDVCTKNVPHALVYAPEADSLFYCGAGLRYITDDGMDSIEQCYALRADGLSGSAALFERAGYNTDQSVAFDDNDGEPPMNRSSDVEIHYNTTTSLYERINHYGFFPTSSSADAQKFTSYATQADADSGWSVEGKIETINVNKYWVRSPVRPIRTIRLKKVQGLTNSQHGIVDDYNSDGFGDFVFDFFTENLHTDVDEDISFDVIRSRIARTCADDPGSSVPSGGHTHYLSYMKARLFYQTTVPIGPEFLGYIKNDYNILQAVDLDDELHTYMLLTNDQTGFTESSSTALVVDNLRGDDPSSTTNLFKSIREDLVLAVEGDRDDKEVNDWYSSCADANTRTDTLAQDAVVSTKDLRIGDDDEYAPITLYNEFGTSVAVHPEDSRRVLVGTRSGKVYDILIKNVDLFPGADPAELGDFSAYSDYGAQLLDDSQNSVLLNVYEIEDNAITNLLIDKQDPTKAWVITEQGVYSFSIAL